MKLSNRILTLCFVCLFYSASSSGYTFAQNCELEILHTNDLHGRLLPFDLGISDYKENVGGVARRKTLIDKIKDKKGDTNILVLDAGDIAQGTIFFNLYNGIKDIELLNKLGYNAAAIGNHEFDKGDKVLAGMIEKADFPFLAANLEFDQASPLYGKVKPYTIIDTGAAVKSA